MSFNDLPYIDTRDNAFVPRVSSDDSKPSTAKPPKEKIEQDKRLKKWEDWMKERGDVNQYLSKHTKRPEDQLLLNSIESYREIQEKRMAVEYSKIPFPYDRYRGNPAFWKMPTALNKICDEPQAYYTTMTKVEKGKLFYKPGATCSWYEDGVCIVAAMETPSLLLELADLEPVLMVKLKMILYRKLYNLNKSKYFQEVLQLEDMKRIEPHRPDARKLAIVGHAPPAEVDNVEKFEKKLSYLGTICGDEHMKNVGQFLKLNEVTIKDNQTGVQTVTITHTDVKCGHLKTIYLRIKNGYKYRFKFNFQRILKKQHYLFKTPPDSSNTKPVFFYNKNIHILLPEDEIDFPFWFKTPDSGPYNETIEMILDPDLWDGNLKIHIFLQIIVGDSNIYDRMYIIYRTLERRARDKVISDALDSIFKKIPIKPSEVTVYTYDKAKIFEAINSACDPFQLLPKYKYDKEVVEELEQFFERVRMEKDPIYWNYSLETLRDITSRRLQHNEEEKLQLLLDELREKIEACEVKRADLNAKAESFWIEKKKGKGGKEKKQKPKKEKKEKKAKVGKAGKAKMVEPIRSPIPKTISDELEDIIRKLKTPNVWKFQHLQRLNTCYILLGSYIDKICEEVTSMEAQLSLLRLLPKERKYILVGGDRLYDEKLLSTSVEWPRSFETVRSLSEKKAPDWVNTIPLENFDERFAAYQSNGKDSKKKKDKKGKKDIKGKKAISEGKKSSLSTLPTLVAEQSKIAEETLSKPDSEMFIPEETRILYNNNLYLIFHRHLDMFLDDLLSVFDLLPPAETSPLELKGVYSTESKQFQVESVDSSVETRIFDLKHVISDMLLEGKGHVLEQNIKFVDTPTLDVSKPCESIWDIFQNYCVTPKTTQPDKEGDVYTLPVPEIAPKMTDQETDVTPEEVILDRGVQADLCTTASSISIDQVYQKTFEDSCQCATTDISTRDSIFSFYKSVSEHEDLDSDTSSDSDDLCKKDKSEEVFI